MRMSSQVIHRKGVNRGFFSQDTQGVISHTYVLQLIPLLQGTDVIGITVCLWMMHEGHIFHIPKLTTYTQTRTITHRGKHPGDIFFSLIFAL